MAMIFYDVTYHKINYRGSLDNVPPNNKFEVNANSTALHICIDHHKYTKTYSFLESEICLVKYV